jgi:hypothetical protein
MEAMPTARPRVQVTIDTELAEALAAIPEGGSRSRLIRDLALRGARARQEESDRYQRAVDHLRGIALGEIDYDFDESRAAHAQRDSA